MCVSASSFNKWSDWPRRQRTFLPTPFRLVTIVLHERKGSVVDRFLYGRSPYELIFLIACRLHEKKDDRHLHLRNSAWRVSTKIRSSTPESSPGKFSLSQVTSTLTSWYLPTMSNGMPNEGVTGHVRLYAGSCHPQAYANDSPRMVYVWIDNKPWWSDENFLTGWSQESSFCFRTYMRNAKNISVLSERL